MRIQHNISALNSYRNYTNNTNMVSKNLEKLSSGYRINRAGDDAAGLAISEKMRAQITGLATAQKNAQDGVSLVQTAEGAMTEIHSMLNRMTELATQSSNGTYSDAVDRENIQEEYNALAAEIDRIADATNFNGINLLDGTLGGAGKGGAIDGLTTVEHDAEAFKAEFTVDDLTGAAGTLSDGQVVKFSITYQDSKGKTHTTTLEATYTSKAAAGTGASAGYFTVNGKKVDITATNDKPTKADIEKVFLEAAKGDSALSETFKITGNSAGKITLEAKQAGANSQIKGISYNYTSASGVLDKWSTATVTSTAGADAYESFDFAGAGTNNFGKVFTINGKKFAIAADADSAAKMDKDVNVVIAASSTALAAGDVKELASLIEQKTGYKPEIDSTTNTQLNFKGLAPGKGGGSGEGITLQIGDTADEFNQLTVSVSDMHAAALGVDGLNLLDQDSAKDSINVIKDAINTVSAARGKLGAAQNRLEHTINNLSVTEENMSAAESRIRDTDVAKEMMSYTKNNILVQSAQAMLAQANQTPQGVLQLLQ